MLLSFRDGENDCHLAVFPLRIAFLAEVSGYNLNECT